MYEPTWENVYSTTLVRSCGLEGGCHAPDAASGGFEVSEDPSATYLSIQARIDDSDAECSLVVRHIAAEGADGMPPGSPLPDSELCAIQLWIEAGALEDGP